MTEPPAVDRGPEAEADPIVAVGTIRRPHGVRGELAATLSADQAESLAACPDILVERAGRWEPFELQAVRGTTEKAILQLAGIDDRDAAAALRGATIGLRRSQLPAVEEGEILHADLVGARLLDAGGGQLGVVVEVLGYPGGDVLVVEQGTGRGLVAWAVVEADPEVLAREGTLSCDPGQVAWEGAGR